MKKFLLLVLTAVSFSLSAQHTFSIVAVDTATGEVGSAGATCLDTSMCETCEALIISDVIPGKGAIHTQAWYEEYNQDLAHKLMLEGFSPQKIIDSVNSLDFNFERRQYGIVDFDSSGNVRTAGYTGVLAQDWKGHLLGFNYAIQGNILLGPEILDSMEARFLNTQGSLADKLMAALQGANVPGADTRCLSEGISSASSFIRVAQPADDSADLYLDLHVPNTPVGHEPIDSLQKLFNFWKGECDSVQADFEWDQVLPVKTTPPVTFKDKSRYAANRIWHMGDGNIVYDSTEFSYTYADTGVYEVMLIISNQNCSDTSVVSVNVQGGSGVRDAINSKIEIHPNPAKDKFTVIIPGEAQWSGESKFILYNLLGSKIYETKTAETFTVKRNNLPAGMYFYELKKDGQVLHNGKIIFQ